MAETLSRYTASSTNYEPEPRYSHISGRVGSKAIVQGGQTASNSARQRLTAVVEVFDPYSELWEQRHVKGTFPSLYAAASASLNNDLFSFGGFDGKEFSNTLHKLDTKTWCWNRLSHNTFRAPMPKRGCGMIVIGNNLGVIGGYGIPQGHTDPGSLVKFTAHRGWTNEFHIYSLSEGVWSTPVTTGERPPPCVSFTLTAVDDRKAVMFGGRIGEKKLSNDTYIIDLSIMHWRKLRKSESRLWPEERSSHAACCLNYGERFPQLLVTCGLGKQEQPFADAWILDVERENWHKQEGTILKARWRHSLTAFSLGPGLTEVVEFGGTPGPWTGSSEKQPKMADTTILHFKVVQMSEKYGWKLLSVISNTQRGSQQRMIEKLGYTAESWQQSIGQRNMTQTERQGFEKTQEERREIDSRKKQLEEREKFMQWETYRTNAEKMTMQKQVMEAQEKMRVLEGERYKAIAELTQVRHEIVATTHMAETRVREAEEKVRIAESLKERAVERRKSLELSRDLLLVETERVSVLEGEIMRTRREAEQEKAILRLEKREVEAQIQAVLEERKKSIIDKQKLEETMRILQCEISTKGVKAKQEMELLSQDKKQADKVINMLEKERDNAMENERKVKIERDILEEKINAANIELEQMKEKLRLERDNSEEKIKTLERKRNKEKMAVDAQLDKAKQEKQIAEERIRMLELEATLAEEKLKQEVEVKIMILENESHKLIEENRALKLERDKVWEEKRKADRKRIVLGEEMERARITREVENKKCAQQILDSIERVKVLENERDEAVKMQNKAEFERKCAECDKQVLQKKVTEMEEEKHLLEIQQTEIAENVDIAINEMQHRSTTKTDIANEVEERAIALQEQLEMLRNEKEELQKTASAFEERMRILEGERDREMLAKTEVQKRVTETEDRIKLLEEEREREKSELQAKIKELQQKVTDTEDRVKLLEEEREREKLELQTRINELQQKVTETEDRIKPMEEEREKEKLELQARINELQQKVEDLEREKRDKVVVQQQVEQHSASWEVHEDELEVTEEEVGCGGWAKVKVAKLKVAAKCLHSQLVYDYHQQLFRREMNMAARVSHPNLLRFLGAKLEGGMVILTEFMPTSLRAVINRQPRQHLSMKHILSISVDVARALTYLHNMSPDSIIHRDLSSANVLLRPYPNGGWLAKVSDYGTANFASQLQTENPGSPVYTAPESRDPALQTSKMDIYSFGVLLLEMCTCEFPVPERRAELLESIDDPQLLKLIRQCLNDDKDKRPTATQIVDFLLVL